MRLAFSLVSASLLATVSAHFQLQFPPPRGPFVQDDEVHFCDGYTNVTTNRTVFPLSGGFFSLNSEHNQWTAGVLLSTGAANSFSSFKQIKPFFQQTGEGIYCFPLSFDSPNATGLTNGENVTIQIIFDGSDGELFQCADLTLSSSVNLSTTADHCSNGTSTSSTSSGSGTSTSSGAAATNTKSAAERVVGSGLLTVVLGLVGLAAGLSI